MRIHGLELQALGPFAGREVIDFDSLGSGILLVNGPTGSGKSSLLDAIAYALFGDVPGARKSLKSSLRSHHAPDDREPFVELIFSVGPQRWKIERHPEWDAPKKRVREGTSATTRRHASVLLSRWRDEAWHAESTRLDEAGQVIGDILGMGLAQFAQVIVLPQGEFAAFLRAKPEDRRMLLERLFDVERFDRIEQWFIERKGNSARARSESLANLENYLAIVGESVASFNDATLLAPGSADENLSSLRDDIANIVLAVATEHTQRQHTSHQASDHATRARVALTLASSILRAQAIWNEAQADAEEWTSERVAALGATGERAKAAKTVVDGQSRQERAEALFHEAQISADTALAKLDSELAESPIAAHQLLTLIRTGAIDLTDEKESFERSLRESEDAAKAQQAFTKAESSFAEAEAECAEAARTRDAIDQDLLVATEVEAATQLRLEGTPDASRSVQQIEKIIKDLSTRAPHLHEETDQAQEAFEKATQGFADAEARILRLRTQRLDGIAAELARDLTDGEECPVCGSCAHPAPARPLPDAPSDDAIKAAEKLAAQCNEVRLKAGSHKATCDEALAGFIHEIQQRLAETDDESVQGLNAETLVVASWNEDAGGPADLLEAYESLVGAVAARLDLVETLRVASEAVQTLRQRRQDAELAQIRCAAARESAAAILIQAQDARDTAQRIWHEAQLTLAKSTILPWTSEQGSLADAVASYRRIENALALVNRTQELSTWREETLKEATHERDDLLLQSPFANMDEVRASALDEASIEDVNQQWHTGITMRARIEQTLSDPEIQAAAFTPEPRLEALQDAVTRAEETVQKATADEAQWATAKASLLRMQERIHDELVIYEKLNTDAATMGALADAFAGGGDNERKMRLTSYVLAAHLEMVTTFANHRLTRMSGGRYQLQHTDERASHGRKSGLGLEVIDAWTGRSRDTATLSGGEAFMASLALALGLGDAVLADSGGMKLDTLFVDEGFGSLDQDTLEEVMAVLDELREGGRLVGIISHVSELRARIPTRIDVIKGPEGSHTRVPDALKGADA